MQSGRERLAEYRKRSKLNQRELARLIGITEAYLSQLLSGKRFPGRNNSVKIERFTGVPVEAWSEQPRGKSDRTKRATAETASLSR